MVRALLDNNLMEGHGSEAPEFGLPSSVGAIQLSIPYSGIQLSSYTFWNCNVGSGAHSVKIQAAEATDVVMRSRTLTILGR